MLKFLLVAGLACAIGFGGGFATGWHMRLDDPVLAIRSQLRETVSSENFATALSLSVLLTLEKGDVERAKSKLARQIAEYQHSWGKYDGALPKQPKLLPLILSLKIGSGRFRSRLGNRRNYRFAIAEWPSLAVPQPPASNHISYRQEPSAEALRDA
jgi:hypothetical protein